MAGIYLHIPFCKQACNYCNFHFTTSLRYKGELVQALLKEAELQKDFLKDETIATIYFGGGTPSLLPMEDIELLLKKLFSTFSVSTDAEITLEANPDDINEHKLKGWKENGINRLSIGVQSFIAEELRWMNRAHSSAQAFTCIEQSLRYSFTNMSIDLIYGSPLLTDEQWHQNVTIATDYGIPHLSCYALTVEEKTPLHKLISNNEKLNTDADKQARQFLLLMRWLKEKGYEHYEVSNFAKPGFRSLHNSSYWKGVPYLGLGPAAHSYNGAIRKWNVANNNTYIQSINKGIITSESEILTPVQQLNEYIMISLRTMEGLDLNKVQDRWGSNKTLAIEKGLKRYINSNLITQNAKIAQLTDEGMLMADGIAAALFS